MNRLFNMDNIVMQTLGKLFDLVVLNIVFIISCIPVLQSEHPSVPFIQSR